MRRVHKWLIVSLVLALFLVASALLARFLTVENAERDQEEQLLVAEAAGDAPALITQLEDCAHDQSCVVRQRANARLLARKGRVTIISLQSPTAYSLSGASGRTRVAWRVPGRLPVVQCVMVRRNGSFLTGISVRLLDLSPPIGNTADC